MKRRTRRTAEEQIEDMFADLPYDRQDAMLEKLKSLRRWVVRMQGDAPSAAAAVDTKPPAAQPTATNGQAGLPL